MKSQSLSARSIAALEVVQAGGRITHRLERQYSGREQFEYRLWDASGARVKGFGFAALSALVDSREVERDWGAIFGSTAQRVYVARVAVAAAA